MSPMSFLFTCTHPFFSQFTKHTNNPHKYWVIIKNVSSLKEPKVENMEYVMNVSCTHTCCIVCGQCIINLSCITTVTWVFASCKRLMGKTYTTCQSCPCQGHKWDWMHFHSECTRNVYNNNKKKICLIWTWTQIFKS